MINSKLSSKPLCVDLDGTLIATDTLWESVLLLLRHHFFVIFRLPRWLKQGKAHLKHQIAQHITLDVANLPYHENVLTFLQHEKKKGRMLVLATAAHQTIAQAVADHLKLFDVVIASDAHINMKGATKRDALKQRFKTYDYIGDSRADLPILLDAHEAFLVAPSRALLKQFTCPPDRIFSPPRCTVWDWLKALRPHQWSKNVLIFLPLFLAHQLFDLSKLGDTLLAFIAFSLTASSGYVLNDLLDLAADRIHPSKKHRPFASGRVPIQYGLFFFVSLVILSFSLSLLCLPLNFTGMLALYLLITITYSLYLKQKLFIDVLVLAGLYTHRILAGGVAVSVTISSWLLAFSLFIFLSLAFLKRYVELLQLTDQKVIKHRSYEVGDIEMIASMGPTNGYLAVLVFALYINHEQVKILYSSPQILWLICPILLYWISRVWFLAHRQQMLDDPVQFALTDKISWIVVASITVLMLLANIV
jgi:4-hydroxybenzoate polyprenyltransferase/phosphoserine phosphatase